MGCAFKARLNQLWSIWYTLLVLSVQSYLLYLGFERYKLYNDMKWPTAGFPNIWLTAYIALYGACVPASLLFFSFGFFKSGNIAGDNERLADREERTIEISRNRRGEKSGCLHGLKSIWQHGPPLPQQIHILMAMCQLIAQQLMMAQLYRHGFINSGDFLNTEMDFLYQRARQLATNLPMGDTRLQGFRITADELSGSPLAPHLLPLLMHVRLFGIPLEFVNLVFALIAYSCAYPSVFWRINKTFSLLFSFHLLIYSATTIWSYLSFSILFRIQETNFNSLRPVGLGQYLVSSKRFPFYHPYAIIGMFVTTFVLTTIAPIALYTYGYNKYYINLMNLQSKNLIRSGSHTGQSEYSKKSAYGRMPSKDLCCDGYGPHTVAIVLLVLIVIVKAPTIYALMVLYQHDERPILLTCIIVDVVYLFTWILLWLLLTLKREWQFVVAHKVHHIYALQKFGAAGHINGNENPSQLKNAMIVMHRDLMFVTDDQAVKQSLLKHVQKQQTDVTDETFWHNKNGGHGSPSTRKIPEALKNTPEMSRLMHRSSEEQSQAAVYQSVNRPDHYRQQTTASLITSRGNSSPPENSFGTLQRNQQGAYGNTLQRNQASGTLQRSMPPGQWPTQQEAYASIHKQKVDAVLQRRGSNDGPTYGQIDNYATYGSYARLPAQTRIPVQPGQQVQTMRINGSNYGIQQRRPSDSTPSIGGIRQSPLLSERSTPAVIGSQSTTLNREQSPYQRSTVKLSSFNGQEKGGVYGTSPNQWATQRAPPGQPSQLLWNQNKPSLSTSSSQQDPQCFTPTSTLTSGGSASNYSSQHTPTPGSPQASSSYGRSNGAAIYGALGEDYGEKTLQKQLRQATGSTSVRHSVKIAGARNDDSANFSLASSTGSNETMRQVNNDFATSIV